MGDKKAKWQEHLKAAEALGLNLSAYAMRNQINVHRLYEAKRLRAQQSGSGWAVVRIKPDAAVEARGCAAPTAVAIQARLGNGVVLSWTHDQRNADTPCGVLRALAALPCFI
jgi:hypothetical protein